ncbi:MAG: hypothetical protein ACAH95_14925 [Fimbriimonas sp.]
MSKALLLLVVVGASMPAMSGQDRPSHQDALLGEWVSIHAGPSEQLRMTLSANGTVQFANPDGHAQKLYFMREPFEEWRKRRGADLYEDVDSNTEIVRLSSSKSVFPDTGGAVMFFDHREQVLSNPFVSIFVRPTSPLNWKANRKRMQSARTAPFAFLHGQQAVAGEPGEWDYSFNAPWRKLLIKAAKELTNCGFEPAVPIEEDALQGKTGTVMFYRSYGTEHIALAPNTRSKSRVSVSVDMNPEL